MAQPNIISVTSIRGNTAVQNVSTVNTAIVTNAASSNKVYKINSLIISNANGNFSADATVDFFRNNRPYPIAKTIAVPADASLVVISKDTSIYLEEGDALRCTASANNFLEAICSYEEIT